jgi:hypothetical protein
LTFARRKWREHELPRVLSSKGAPHQHLRLDLCLRWQGEHSPLRLSYRIGAPQ